MVTAPFPVTAAESGQNPVADQLCAFQFPDGASYDLTPFEDTIGYRVYDGTIKLPIGCCLCAVRYRVLDDVEQTATPQITADETTPTIGAGEVDYHFTPCAHLLLTDCKDKPTDTVQTCRIDGSTDTTLCVVDAAVEFAPLPNTVSCCRGRTFL